MQVLILPLGRNQLRVRLRRFFIQIKKLAAKYPWRVLSAFSVRYK